MLFDKSKFLIILFSMVIFSSLSNAQTLDSNDKINGNALVAYSDDIVLIERIVRLRILKMIDPKKAEVALKKIMRGELSKTPYFTDYGVLIKGDIIPMSKAIRFTLSSMGNKFYIKDHNFTYSIYGEINGIVLFLSKMDGLKNK